MIFFFLVFLCLIALFELYPINTPNPFKSASSKCTDMVRYGHLNALYTRVES